jgi:hypothetical protein
VDFVMVNPVAWFLPNIIFGLSLLAATGVLSFSGPPPPPAVVLMQLSQFASLSGVLGLLGSVPLWAVPLLVVFIHFVMVFRGLLFQELTSGSARQRDFRRRMAR